MKLIIQGFMVILALCVNTANAGGTIFPIQVTDIKTVSQKEHKIYFKLLEKVGGNSFAYPLDNCKTATLTIEFKEWEFHHKIFLFF